MMGFTRPSKTYKMYQCTPHFTSPKFPIIIILRNLIFGILHKFCKLIRIRDNKHKIAYFLVQYQSVQILKVRPLFNFIRIH